MAHSDFLDALLKPHVNGDGPAGLFYRPIKATDDLITSSRLRGRSGERLSELHIAPPSVKLGSLPTKILDDLNRQLVLSRAPSADEVVRVEIDALLAAFGGGDPAARNVLQVALEQNELTGPLNAAARKLNQSTLSPVERAILSRPNIAMYAYYRAAIGMNVKDVDGITTNVLSSLGKVLSFVNRELVSEVLKSHNLQAEPEEVRALQDRLAGRYISYEGSDATRAVLEDYQHVKGNGELIGEVNKFLDSGFVDVPADVSRDQLVRAMIGYLEESGFNPRALLGLNASFRATINGLKVLFEDQSVDDGRVTSWMWDFGDGNTSNMRNPSHTYTAPSRYTVTLTVGDDEGNTESVSRTLAVTEVSSTPSVEIEYTTSHLQIHCRARYTGRAGITEYRWLFGDDNESDEPEPSHTYVREGEYTIRLDVKDEAGGAAWTQRKIKVSRPPERPVPDFIVHIRGLNARFHDKSVGKIKSRKWQFGDGSTSERSDPRHTYGSAGTYTVRLTVVAENGLEASKEQALHVGQPGGPIIITGKLVDPDGHALEGLVVRATSDKTILGEEVLTDAEGRFDIKYGVDAPVAPEIVVSIFDAAGKDLIGAVRLAPPESDHDLGALTVDMKAYQH